jgi:hypothetical protein
VIEEVAAGEFDEKRLAEWVRARLDERLSG